MGYKLHAPGDSLTYDFDFSAFAVDAVTVDDFEVTIAPATATATKGTLADSKAAVRVSGIEFAKVYRVTVTAELSTGEFVAKELTLRGGAS